MLIYAERVPASVIAHGVHPLFSIGRDEREVEERAPGKHLSDYLREIAIASKLVDWDEEKGEWEPSWLMEMGHGWEARAVRLAGCVPSISGTVWQPGEMEVGGIAMNMDGYSQEVEWVTHPGHIMNGAKVSVLEEFKATRKAVRQCGGVGGSKRAKDFENEWMWLAQCKGYLKGLSEMTGTSHCHARLHVLYLNGEYEKGVIGEEQYWRYWIEFAWPEVVGNWNMILKWRDKQKHGNA